MQADVSKDIECIATINKAIEKWEEMALLGKQPLENLLKTVNLLHELKCYYEIATFVVWTYTNFSEEVSDF